MRNIIAKIQALFADKRGMSALEYALLAVALGGALVAAAPTLTTTVQTAITGVGTSNTAQQGALSGT